MLFFSSLKCTECTFTCLIHDTETVHFRCIYKMDQIYISAYNDRIFLEPAQTTFSRVKEETNSFFAASTNLIYRRERHPKTQYIRFSSINHSLSPLFCISVQCQETNKSAFSTCL
mmetsp:Transcript_30957/g.45074  ORF Transcript_30957/g.45074 Transcript_30957/m.45074 type:complete len:115 (+) Transcript_30957:586-930(+)